MEQNHPDFFSLPGGGVRFEGVVMNTQKGLGFRIEALKEPRFPYDDFLLYVLKKVGYSGLS